jgi:hypothetical protein
MLTRRSVGIASVLLATTLGISPAAQAWTCHDGWAIEESAAPPGSGISDVVAIAPNDAWLVGTLNSTALTRHWDGVNWITVPNPATDPSGLVAVTAGSSSDVWAVGAEVGSPLFMHWDGIEWTTVPDPIPPVGATGVSMFGVSATSTGEAWAVGYYYNNVDYYSRTLAFQWKGSMWSHVPTPTGAYYSAFYGVHALSESDAWAVGYQSVIGGLPLTLAERWDGSEWTTVPMADPYPLAYVWGVSAIASDAWAVGYGSTGNRNASFTQRWNGQTWALVPSPHPGFTGTGLTDVVAIQEDEALAVGWRWPADGPVGTMIEAWDGFKWRVTHSQNAKSNNGLSRISALPSGDGWAVGAYRGNPLVLHRCPS